MLAKVRLMAGGVLVVTPPPGWEARDAEAAIQVVETLIQPGNRYSFVGDVTHMSGYEPGARRAWQSWFGKRRKLLVALWMVGPKIHPFVMMGILAMSAFLRVEFHFARSLEEIPGLQAETHPEAGP